MYPTQLQGREYSRPTPLYYAALLDLCGVAEWLVNKRSQDINALGGYYGTPLHAACATGSLEVALFLLTCHADGNRVSDDHTIFYVASEGGQVTVPGVLLDKGANINAINDNGDTPLTVALKDGPMKTLMEITNLLLGHGANPNLTRQGLSPIYWALSYGLPDIVHLLQRYGADPNTRDDDEKTPLHAASEKGELKVAEGLLELGADVNSRDDQGRTPLHVIQWASDDVALLLLEHGADSGVQDDAGQTPLHVASRLGSLKFAQQLLELGCDVNSRDNQGRTPLHVIEWESDDVALLLLEHDADPGIQDYAGQTPLHAASRLGNPKLAQWLLDKGFDANLRDNQGKTPLHLTQRRSEDVPLLLLEHGADPGIRDDNGETPLHAASRSGNPKLTQWLLDKGFDANLRDNQGRTPLHLTQMWSEDVPLLLLEHGADPGIRDDAGQTPLHAAS